MNLRQAQRSLAELISKCEAVHIQLPEDPLEARAEAVEAIIHSLKDDKVNLGDAQEELQQKFGFELVWKQQIENQEARRQRRRQQSKSPTAPKDPRLMNFGLLPEAPPPTKDGGRKSKGGVMTPSKRPATGHVQQTVTTKVAKKARGVRELIVPRAPAETEEKRPIHTKKKATAGLGDLLEDDESTGSPDQDIAALLDFEDLDEGAEGSSNLSSDEEFAL
ncbi:hypothetical protein V7S43_003657 [Phytophthora oleae]|uniref:Borealin N-terminal domain-containing protein n=1 Tax=Phytophthora oleae TaxID=2107226 RepID=A0ABD3FXU8_9STRA